MPGTKSDRFEILYTCIEYTFFDQTPLITLSLSLCFVLFRKWVFLMWRMYVESNACENNPGLVQCILILFLDAEIFECTPSALFTGFRSFWSTACRLVEVFNITDTYTRQAIREVGYRNQYTRPLRLQIRRNMLLLERCAGSHSN